MYVCGMGKSHSGALGKMGYTNALKSTFVDEQYTATGPVEFKWTYTEPS